MRELINCGQAFVFVDYEKWTAMNHCPCEFPPPSLYLLHINVTPVYEYLNKALTSLCDSIMEFVQLLQINLEHAADEI